MENRVIFHKNKGRGKSARGSKSKSKQDPQIGFMQCWICHSEDNGLTNYELSATEKFTKAFGSKERYQPCLCKGSMQKLHKECVSKWAKEKYLALQKTSLSESQNQDDGDTLPEILCPNCKYSYNYTVKESYAYRCRSLTEIQWFSMEMIVMIVLLLMQITLLTLDILLRDSVKREAKENAIMKVSNVLHIFTVIVIIGAACFNLVQVYAKEIKIEVHDKHAIITD